MESLGTNSILFEKVFFIFSARFKVTYLSILTLWALAATKQAEIAIIDGGNNRAASVFKERLRNSSACGLKISTFSIDGQRVRRSIKNPSKGR